MTNVDFRPEIIDLRDKDDDIQLQVYIVAGVLGGVCAALVVFVIVLFCVVSKLNKKIKDVEENARIQAELNARKYSAYTGEEVHRNLRSALPIPVANVNVPGNSESEYAFNHPVSRDYILNNPPKKLAI